MRGKSLEYVVSVWKGEVPQGRAEWLETLGFLACHRTAGLFYSRAKKLRLAIPAKVERVLTELWAAQVRRGDFLRKWIEDVSEELMAENVEHVFSGESVLSNVMGRRGGAFYAPGERVAEDVEIFVRREDRSAAAQILREMRFMEREEGESSASFLRRTNNAEVPFIKIELRSSLVGAAEGGGELAGEFLESRWKYRGRFSLYAAREELFMIRLLLDAAGEREEGTFEICRLADIYYFWHSGLFDEEEVKQLAFAYEIERQVGRALRRTARFFADGEMLAASEEYGVGGWEPVGFGDQSHFLLGTGLCGEQDAAGSA